tara:strand:- start:162 stop:458 length:297 start_codon:yes stop_codon:yes gene_type:complete
MDNMNNQDNINNPYLRNFYFSSATFSEYKVTLDIRYIDSINDIIQDCKKDLLKTLETHNFVELIRTCNGCNFHIHTHTLDDILTCSEKEKIYICDGHC